MGEQLSTGYKIAIATYVMVCVLFMGISLVYIGRNAFNKYTDQTLQSIDSTDNSDALALASYGKPVPIAEVWKLTQRISSTQGPDNVNGNFTSFVIKKRNATDPNTWDLVSDKVSDLDSYMDQKAYLSWEMDTKTGLYKMEVLLAQ